MRDEFGQPGAAAGKQCRKIFIIDGTNKGQWRTIAQFKNRLFAEEKRSYIKVDRPFAKAIDRSTIYVIQRDAATQPAMSF